MPLTRSQVRAAFKAARKHFKGKIPKGTKLARFVPGHHSSPASSSRRSSPTRHHSRTSSTSSSGGSHSMKTSTKAVHITAAVIAFNREIAAGLTDFMNGTLVSNPTQALQDLRLAAVGLQNDNTINPTQLTASVVSKLAGYGFDKIGMWFMKRVRL